MNWHVSAPAGVRVSGRLGILNFLYGLLDFTIKCNPNKDLIKIALGYHLTGKKRNISFSFFLILYTQCFGNGLNSVKGFFCCSWLCCVESLSSEPLGLWTRNILAVGLKKTKHKVARDIKHQCLFYKNVCWFKDGVMKTNKQNNIYIPGQGVEPLVNHGTN